MSVWATTALIFRPFPLTEYTLISNIDRTLLESGEPKSHNLKSEPVHQTGVTPSGIIVSDWMEMTKNQFSEVNCGIPTFFSTVHGRRMKFNILVRPTGTGSDLTVNCQYQERRRLRGADFYATCLSNGLIEQSIKNEILAHLNKNSTRNKGSGPYLAPSNDSR